MPAGERKGCDVDGHAAIGDERTLRRIIALLVSLAALAELTAARSLPVRLLVLWILRRAETAAEDFVFAATGAPPATMAIAAAGDGPADALRLAARFHALAAALGALLPVAARPGRRPARGLALIPMAPGSGCGWGCWKRRPNDTS